MWCQKVAFCVYVRPIIHIITQEKILQSASVTYFCLLFSHLQKFLLWMVIFNSIIQVKFLFSKHWLFVLLGHLRMSHCWPMKKVRKMKSFKQWFAHMKISVCDSHLWCPNSTTNMYNSESIIPLSWPWFLLLQVLTAWPPNEKETFRSGRHYQ